MGRAADGEKKARGPACNLSPVSCGTGCIPCLWVGGVSQLQNERTGPDSLQHHSVLQNSLRLLFPVLNSSSSANPTSFEINLS